MNGIPKMVIVVRKDLNMRKGKIAAQVAHSVTNAILNYDNSTDNTQIQIDLTQHEVLNEWLSGLYTKICVTVDSDEELLRIYNQATNDGINVHLVTDMGLTEFHGVPTLTCLAIGPDYPQKIDHITSNLKLL